MSHVIQNQGVGVANWANPINSSTTQVTTFVAVGDPT
jgi:hypothetical protein